MKQRMLKALKAHAEGNIEKHKVNIEVYMHNAVGIGEHPDVMAAIESEIDKISHYHDQLEVIEKYLQ